MLRQAILLAQTFDDPSRLGFAGAAARYLGDDTATHDFYARAVARARATGELVLLPYLLESLAVAEVAAGRYTAATASATAPARSRTINLTGHLHPDHLISARQGEPYQALGQAGWKAATPACQSSSSSSPNRPGGCTAVNVTRLF